MVVLLKLGHCAMGVEVREQDVTRWECVIIMGQGSGLVSE